MNEIDEEFAEVLAYLRATRQEAHTDRHGETTLRPSSVHQRKAIARARWKRIKKMERRREHG